MQSSFWSKSLNKLNDTEIVDNNMFCYRQDSTTKTSYKSSCWEKKTSRITLVHVVSSGDRWWEYDGPEETMTTINLKFQNPNTYKVHIKGGFWLYPSGTNS